MAEPRIRRRPRRRHRRPLLALTAGESGRGPGASGSGRISPAAWDLPGGLHGAAAQLRYSASGSISALLPQHPPAVWAASPLLPRAEVRPDPQTLLRGVGVHPAGSRALVWNLAREGGEEAKAWGLSLGACSSSLCDLGQVPCSLWPRSISVSKEVVRLAAHSG